MASWDHDDLRDVRYKEGADGEAAPRSLYETSRTLMARSFDYACCNNQHATPRAIPLSRLRPAHVLSVATLEAAAGMLD